MTTYFDLESPTNALADDRSDLIGEGTRPALKDLSKTFSQTAMTRATQHPADQSQSRTAFWLAMRRHGDSGALGIDTRREEDMAVDIFKRCVEGARQPPALQRNRGGLP